MQASFDLGTGGDFSQSLSEDDLSCLRGGPRQPVDRLLSGSYEARAQHIVDMYYPDRPALLDYEQRCNSLGVHQFERC